MSSDLIDKIKSELIMSIGLSFPRPNSITFLLGKVTGSVSVLLSGGHFPVNPGGLRIDEKKNWLVAWVIFCLSE